MSKEEKIVRFQDLPKELQDDVINSIYNYTTCFITIKEKPYENALLAGSGTLTEIGGVRGILTADHVIESLPTTGDIGFILHRDTIPRNFSVNAESIQKIRIARGAQDESGPDLGFVILPIHVLDQFAATKSFYNISSRKHLASGSKYPNIGFWSFCGYIDEFTKTDPPQRGYDIVKQFQGRLSLVSIKNNPKGTRPENIYIAIDYSIDEGMPNSFGGLSGGGLWQIVIAETQNQELTIKELNLLGVVFYESGIIDRKRHLICNGHKDIYINAVDIVSRFIASR